MQHQTTLRGGARLSPPVEEAPPKANPFPKGDAAAPSLPAAAAPSPSEPKLRPSPAEGGLAAAAAAAASPPAGNCASASLFPPAPNMSAAPAGAGAAGAGASPSLFPPSPPLPLVTKDSKRCWAALAAAMEGMGGWEEAAEGGLAAGGAAAGALGAEGATPGGASLASICWAWAT